MPVLSCIVYTLYIYIQQLHAWVFFSAEMSTSPIRVRWNVLQTHLYVMELTTVPVARTKLDV